MLLLLFLKNVLSLVWCHVQSHSLAAPAAPVLPVPEARQGGGHTTAAASRLTSASESTQATLKNSHEILLWPHSQRVPIHRAQGGKFTLARDGVHLIDLASYAFILSKGTKQRERTQTARSLCPALFSSGFLYCPEPFRTAPLAYGALPLPSESLLSRLGRFRRRCCCWCKRAPFVVMAQALSFGGGGGVNF